MTLSIARHAEIVARMKAEITDLIAEGVIPPAIDDFGDLHLFMDANELAGLCDPGDNAVVTREQIDDLQEDVHVWLQQGRPTD